jgi:hypothetical protein
MALMKWFVLLMKWDNGYSSQLLYKCDLKRGLFNYRSFSGNIKSIFIPRGAKKATYSALRDSLNESGAMTIFMLRLRYLYVDV